MNEKQIKLKIIFTLLVVIVLTACTSGSPAVSPTLVASPRLIPSGTHTVAPTVTPHQPSMTYTPSATATFTITPPRQPTTVPELNALRVPVTEYNNIDTYIFLEMVFWSEDGSNIYYALSSDRYEANESTLQWFAYDVQTGISIALTAIPKISHNIVLPLHNLEFYPEVRGLTSPSGRYTFRTAPDESNSETEIWLADLVTHQELLLVTEPCLSCYVDTAEWFSDESKVIFTIGFEYGGKAYLADIQNGSSEPLCQPDDYHCWVGEERLALSPDDSMLAGLAYVDSYFQIRIDTISDRTSTYIMENTSQLTWSCDGRLLYYWSGTPWAGSPITRLRVYDTTSKVSSTVIGFRYLAGQGICPSDYDCNFDVSPDGNQFVFWSRIPYDAFWIVTLP